MSVSVKYKGNEILAIPSSGDYHLNTEGKYLEDDIQIIAEAAPPGSAIIIDTLDSAGGTIREIITDSEIYLQDEKVINPSETKTTVTPDSGYTALQAVTVNAISSTYIGSAIATRSSDDLSASGAVVTVPSGYYGAQATKSVSTTTHPSPSISLNSTTGVVSASHTQGAGYVTAGTTSSTLNLSTESAKTITPSTSTQTAVEAGKYTTGAIKVAAMPSGTAGTPTATKGTVSNHSISITPSVTNSTGYITGGTKTGTAVSVGASELVSGTYNVTSGGTKDVTNYASASVPTLTLPTSTATSSTTGYTLKATINRNTSDRYLNIGTGFNDTSGYYKISGVANGSATTPTKTITANPGISVNSSTGVITASVSGSSNITPTVSAGYVSSGTAGTVSVSGNSTLSLTTQAAKTVTPSTSTQTAVEAGVYTTGVVKVAAVTTGTAGTPTASKSAVFSNRIFVTPSVTNVSGYIEGGTIEGESVAVSASELTSGTYTVAASGSSFNISDYATLNVPAGTQGTPTASKGTVSNHSITVTPRVTNSEGYITGGTKAGTAATVSASELVSGTYTVTSAGTKDVTNYASASVPSGTTGTPSATKGTVSNHAVTVTPSVTNATGWITGGTQTGTAVTVSASELVSGTYTVDSAGTKNVINYASASVPSGTAGTPTANKGSVNDHSITVTPSVTNTTGFITGSTKIGTAVNIKASDLVSGTLDITTNSSFDVTNYATASVNVASETYTLTKSGNSIILTGSNGTTSSVIDSNTTYSNATTSTAGLMSAADKTKFDNWGDVVGALSGSTAIANKSVPSDGNWINLGSFSVPAGTWFIKVLVRFASNATGVRTINISTSSASAADVVWNTAKQQAAATGYTYVHLETFLSPSSTTTYYVNADQTGSAALTAATRYGGIRIY